MQAPIIETLISKSSGSGGSHLGTGSFPISSICGESIRNDPIRHEPACHPSLVTAEGNGARKKLTNKILGVAALTAVLAALAERVRVGAICERGGEHTCQWWDPLSVRVSGLRVGATWCLPKAAK